MVKSKTGQLTLLEKWKHVFVTQRAPHLFVNAAFLCGTSPFRFDFNLQHVVYESSVYHRIRHFLTVGLHYLTALILIVCFIRDFGWYIPFDPSNNIHIMRAAATVGHTVSAILNTNTILKCHDMIQFLNGFDELCISVHQMFDDEFVASGKEKNTKLWFEKLMKSQVFVIFAIPLLTLSNFLAHCDQHIFGPVLQTCQKQEDGTLVHGSALEIIFLAIMQVGSDIGAICASIASFPFVDDTFIRGPNALHKLSLFKLKTRNQLGNTASSFRTWLNYYRKFQIVLYQLHTSSSDFFSVTMGLSLTFCTVGSYFLIRKASAETVELSCLATIYCLFGAALFILINKNGTKFESLSEKMLRTRKNIAAISKHGMHRSIILKSINSCRPLSVNFSTFGKLNSSTMIVGLHIFIQTTIWLLLAS